ncbi:flavonoid 3'-monooxygenase CYP75B137-like [Populus alba x Populus x berolinensis]|nr:flavonoid 3'-monooxygenase CYP75B137-like [Populus alba x Populus x berolinensis]
MTPLTNFLEKFNIDASTSTVVTLLALFAIIWYAWRRAGSKKGRPSLPPGPRGLPLIGNLASLDPDLHTYFAGLARTYGPILKLQLGHKLGIIVSSPNLAREVLKDHDITFANRDVPDVARIAAYGGSDIAWSPYGPEWRMLRKVCVLKMLSNSTLDSVYELRRREVRNIISYIYGKPGSLINVGEQTFLTILNVVTSMLWGGTVPGEERGRLGAEFRRVVADMTELLGAPNISDFFPALARFDLQGLVKKMSGLAPKFDQIFDRMIEKQSSVDALGDRAGASSKDFLQFLLKVKDEGDVKTPLTMTQIKALLMDMVVGGSDTSSNAIEFALAEVMNKPEVMRKAQDELDRVVGEDDIVEESHIRKLPYLHAIMKESLRLHPVLPLLIPHCPSETCTIGGFSVPKGARVFVNVWAVHRDPSIWENPMEFKPERFLNSKFDYSGSDFNYFPFGSGRRICAGIAMAERMFLYFLATLLHSFDWRLPQGKKMDLTEKFGIVLKLKNPLVAIPTPRLSNPALYE